MAAGLSDIPFLGDIVKSTSRATVAAMSRGLRYTIRYEALGNDLKSKIEELNGEKERISRKVNEEEGNGRTIYNDVLEWQKRVDEIQNNAEEISPSWKCIRCLPIPNPVARFHLGKEAELKATTVSGLTVEGRAFRNTEIAHFPPVENVPNTEGEFHNFPSRNDAYEKLLQDVDDEDGPRIVGIYGMAGVGKTRMVQQIWKDAMERRMFNKATLAVVGSQRLDVIDLQTQIARHLGCRLLSEDDKKLRAHQLKKSLMNGGKTVIILDDVWRVITLEDIIGTGVGDDRTWKGYKILFTSRERSVCLNNKCMHPVEITALTGPEAWDLFTNTIGKVEIESLNDKTLAEEVFKKCAALPSSYMLLLNHSNA